ncbi:hypothetical protein SAMN05216317_10237 [Nitrosomonas eutropha]|uniref:Uncharacterized protein n=1 Tax=Nitrosomonas eutropha TaxID=916 RepID=A0ABX5M8Q1_9PROT|nr:hypothetical protein C8R14_12313 [Nitrosomonas eutropha]SDW08782.1 hypothetical protein SAMN05216317_10237 [Nitrosomonas eutropha]
MALSWQERIVLNVLDPELVSIKTIIIKAIILDKFEGVSIITRLSRGKSKFISPL